MLPNSAVGDAAPKPVLEACAQLADRLWAGEDCRAEDFFPAVARTDSADAALELIYTEFAVPLFPPPFSLLGFLLCPLLGSPRKKSWRWFTRVLGLINGADATPLLLKETSMATPSIPTRRQLACKVTFRVQRGPHFLCVAMQGEASFDQAEVLSAQLLRFPLDGHSLVVLDLAELTVLSCLAMGALVEYRRAVGRRGVEVRLANVAAPAWLALESAGLWQLFQPMS